jgi:hypothetical protein
MLFPPSCGLIQRITRLTFYGLFPPQSLEASLDFIKKRPGKREKGLATMPVFHFVLKPHTPFLARNFPFGQPRTNALPDEKY